MDVNNVVMYTCCCCNGQRLANINTTKQTAHGTCKQNGQIRFYAEGQGRCREGLNKKRGRRCSYSGWLWWLLVRGHAASMVMNKINTRRMSEIVGWKNQVTDVDGMNSGVFDV